MVPFGMVSSVFSRTTPQIIMDTDNNYFCICILHLYVMYICVFLSPSFTLNPELEKGRNTETLLSLDPMSNFLCKLLIILFYTLFLPLTLFDFTDEIVLLTSCDVIRVELEPELLLVRPTGYSPRFDYTG